MENKNYVVIIKECVGKKLYSDPVCPLKYPLHVGNVKKLTKNIINH